MVVDFTNKQNLLNEDYLRAVGSWTKWLLGRMFGDDLQIKGKLSEEEELNNANFVIRGKYQDIKAYAVAIGKEKDYIVSYTKYGKARGTSHRYIYVSKVF